MNDHLLRLSHRLATEGPAPLHDDLVRLAARSRLSVPGAAAVLADADAPDVARLRAFSIVARHLTGVPEVDRVA
jgi:hypothetical protein